MGQTRSASLKKGLGKQYICKENTIQCLVVFIALHYRPLNKCASAGGTKVFYLLDVTIKKNNLKIDLLFLKKFVRISRMTKSEI